MGWRLSPKWSTQVMPFSKTDYEPDVGYVVTHPYYPGDEFIFYVAKELSQSAEAREKEFLGLKEEERQDKSRELLTRLVAEITTRPPDGFIDFPADERPLSERFFEYFNDPSKPELEGFITRVWRAHRLAVLEPAYLKSVRHRGEGYSQSSGAAEETQPVV
jgi:hypothetical protein